jgi:uncharacterized repeat protein (TIGR01451 family)
MEKRHLLRMGAVLSLACLVLLALLGTAAAEHPKPERPKLQGVLVQLLDAYETDGPLAAQQVADMHAIKLQEGKVLVIVESETSDMASLAQALAKLGGDIEIVASNRVSALVPVPTLDAIASLPAVAYVRLPLPDDPDDGYFRVRTMTLENGTSIDETVIDGPPTPPPGYDRSVAKIPDKGVKLLAANTLSNVPAFNWSFGCSATSAAMIAGYYDRTAYPNMYTGPTNGGVMPMNNSSWPDWLDSHGDTRHQCPLSATHNGLDGRATNGHVDDYWIYYGQPGPDPWDGNWPEHTYGECTGDFMKTNQWVNPSQGFNTDGSTVFYNYTSGAPLYWYDMESYDIDVYDGGYGVKLFYESRGYTVSNMYNQYILGCVSSTQGFRYDQYKAEIDAGRPVMIHVAGHTMVGFGYNDATNLMYIHDTWDYSDHTMTWGGSYHGMQHYAVTIVQLEAVEVGADLAISKTDDPDPVIPGTPLTYTITVTNTGPLDATGVVVTDTLPLTVTFASSSASQGTCSGTNIIICNLGTINNGASATVTIVVTATASGTFTNTASVASAVTDLDMGNNSATASTTACYDFSGNGVVDVADIQLVASHWHCNCGDVCYDPLYDLDHDCDIDIVDIMLVTAHWGETC